MGIPWIPQFTLGGYGGVFHDLGYDEDEDEDQVEAVQDDGGPGYLPLEFFRMIRGFGNCWRRI